MAKRKLLADVARDTSQYIVSVIDGNDWCSMQRNNSFCAACPARSGAQIIDNEIYNLCSACPLRPLMSDIADLVYRQRRKPPTP